MNKIRAVFSLLWRVWFVFWVVWLTLFFGILFVLPFSFRAKDYKYAYRGMRYWGISLFYIAGLRYTLFANEEVQPDKQYIFVSNHSSLMDIMLILILTRNPMVFIGKKELTKFPIFGAIYNRLAVTVDRKSIRSRHAVYAATQQRIKEGNSICIFPEGGVPDDESLVLSTFKDGAFVMSIEHELPMVVYSFCGLKKAMPYAYFRGGPGRIKVFREKVVPAGKFVKGQMREYKAYVHQLMLKRLEAYESGDL